jgi:hypothetical protein
MALNTQLSDQLLTAMNGKLTPEEQDALRWQSIRNALEYAERPRRETDKAGRLAWAEYLSWAKSWHPEEVAAIRAGQEPTHPDPEAYKRQWNPEEAES